MRLSFTSLALFFYVLSLAQNSTIDSLKSELIKVESDTGKISILIDLSYQITDKHERLSTIRHAYALGKTVESIKHVSRSEIVYGLFLSEYDLDSGILLIDRGAQRYLENNLLNYAANAFYIMGIAYEIENKLDSAISCYHKTFNLALKDEIHPEWGDAAYAISNIHNIRGMNVEALKWSLEAKKAYEKGGKIKELSQALNQIGIIYDQKGLYSEALDHYLKAKELANQVDDIDGEILINNNIGVIYDNMNSSEVAMNYYNDALEKARIHNMPDNEATLLNNMSYIHLRNGDTLKALSLLKKSLEIDLSEIYPCFESYPLEGMGSIYLAKGRLDSAEYYLMKTLKTAEECEDATINTTVYKDFGQLYSKQNKPQQAIKAFNKSLEISKRANLQVETKEVLQALYEFYRSTGNTNMALTYLEQYQKLTDSLSKENSIEKATKLAAEYEFRKQMAKLEKEREASEMKFFKELQAKTNKNRLILLILFLIIVFALALIRGYFLIQKNNKRLKYLNDEKNKLIGIVAHDLRNPLNMIMGLMPLLTDSAEKIDDKDLDKYIELLDASAFKMNNMIDRVLDISAIENMKINLKLDKVDLTALTAKSVDNFSLIASRKGIKIISELNSATPHFSLVDANYLEQVIDNLLSNAIKFSEKDKVIYVTLKTTNNKNEIEVRDEGPGISESEKRRIFDAFTTLSSKPTGEERSTGLGLSIAFKFIQAMKGEILCESKLGEGTAFKLVFNKA